MGDSLLQRAAVHVAASDRVIHLNSHMVALVDDSSLSPFGGEEQVRLPCSGSDPTNLHNGSVVACWAQDERACQGPGCNLTFGRPWSVPPASLALGWTAPTDQYAISSNWTLTQWLRHLGGRQVRPSGGFREGVPGGDLLVQYVCDPLSTAWLRGRVQVRAGAPFNMSVGGDGGDTPTATAHCWNGFTTTGELAPQKRALVGLGTSPSPTASVSASPSPAKATASPSVSVTPSAAASPSVSPSPGLPADKCIVWGTNFACGRFPSALTSGLAVQATPTPTPSPSTLALARRKRELRVTLMDVTPGSAGGFITGRNASVLVASAAVHNFTVQMRDQYGACADTLLQPWNPVSQFNLSWDLKLSCTQPNVNWWKVSCCDPLPRSKGSQAWPPDSIQGCAANFSGQIEAAAPSQALFSNLHCSFTLSAGLAPAWGTQQYMPLTQIVAVGNYTILPAVPSRHTQSILIIIICTILGVLALVIVARRAVRRTMGATSTFDAFKDYDTNTRGWLDANGNYLSGAEAKAAAEAEAARTQAKYPNTVRACLCMHLPVWFVRGECFDRWRCCALPSCLACSCCKTAQTSWPPQQNAQEFLMPTRHGSGAGSAGEAAGTSPAGF